jgi:hypothetical protein
LSIIFVDVPQALGDRSRFLAWRRETSGLFQLLADTRSQ